MNTLIRLPILASVLSILGTFAPAPTYAHDADQQFAARLRDRVKLARLGMDSTGLTVTEPGTVFIIKKGGILGLPPTHRSVPPSTYKEGQLLGPGKFAASAYSQISRFLAVGEKVYITGADVRVKNDKITVFIIECDFCNGVEQPSSYVAAVAFDFPKGYLGAAETSQIKDVINQVLAPDLAPMEPPAQAAQADAQPQAARAPAKPVKIQIGQTLDDVKSDLGSPDKIVDLGKKQIYVYKDLKVTFVDGKVSDVQ
jgi:hypothetical protein